MFNEIFPAQQQDAIQVVFHMPWFIIWITIHTD